MKTILKLILSGIILFGAVPTVNAMLKHEMTCEMAWKR